MNTLNRNGKFVAKHGKFVAKHGKFVTTSGKFVATANLWPALDIEDLPEERERDCS